MEEEVQKQLDVQKELLLKIHVSVEKTRKYFLWTLIISLVVILLPLIGIIFAIPILLSTYNSALGGLL